MFTEQRHSPRLRGAARWFALAGFILASMLAPAWPASAQEAAAPGAGAYALPPAPSEAEAAELAAVTPTMSPAARRTWHGDPGDPWPCPSGNLCVIVWDPTTADWKVFDLYACKRYYLSDWYDLGHFLNNQTGGVTSTFYGQFGDVLRQFTPDYPAVHDQNWDPVWSIRNC